MLDWQACGLAEASLRHSDFLALEAAMTHPPSGVRTHGAITRQVRHPSLPFWKAHRAGTAQRVYRGMRAVDPIHVTLLLVPLAGCGAVQGCAGSALCLDGDAELLQVGPLLLSTLVCCE
jgi:hypothetical protein